MKNTIKKLYNGYLHNDYNNEKSVLIDFIRFKNEYIKARGKHPIKFFTERIKGTTLKDISKIYGITTERTRQAIKKEYSMFSNWLHYNHHIDKYIFKRYKLTK